MNLPILSFLRRYWWLIVILYIGYVMVRSESVFAVLDVFGYLPLAFASWVGLVLLWRNLFNRKTTDQYVDSGRYVKDFDSLPAREKVWFTMIQAGCYLVGGAIITAAIVGNLFG